MSKKMTAEDYLKLEDENFNKKNNLSSFDYDSPPASPETKSKTKKPVKANDIDSLRQMFVEGLAESESSGPVVKTKTMQFKQNEMIADLKKILSKYGLNPNGSVEIEIISTFIRNLYSAKLLKTDFSQ